ncbi:unnamed protein product, partial [marine sediment metagenome]
RFTYNKDGTVKKRTLKTVTWWDTIMVAGGISLVFAIVALIKTISSKIPDWYDDEEQQEIRDHPGLFLALGPIGWAIARKRAGIAAKTADAATGVPKEMADLFTYFQTLRSNYGIVLPEENRPDQPLSDSFVTTLGEISREEDPVAKRVTVKLGWGSRDTSKD